MRTFRVLPGPLYTPAHYARARRYERLEDAVSAMGEGVVVDSSREIVAFHERHLPTIERLAS